MDLSGLKLKLALHFSPLFGVLFQIHCAGIQSQNKEILRHRPSVFEFSYVLYIDIFLKCTLLHCSFVEQILQRLFFDGLLRPSLFPLKRLSSELQCFCDYIMNLSSLLFFPLFSFPSFCCSFMNYKQNLIQTIWVPVKLLYYHYAPRPFKQRMPAWPRSGL